MQNCPRCRVPLRRDESLTHHQGPEGGWGVCPACLANVCGLPLPEPRIYPWGRPVPTEPGNPNSMMFICGVCRQAMRWGDNGQHIRLTETEAPEGIEPGGYQACAECVDRFRPAIHARLVGAGIMRPESQPEEVQGGRLS